MIAPDEERGHSLWAMPGTGSGAIARPSPAASSSLSLQRCAAGTIFNQSYEVQNLDLETVPPSPRSTGWGRTPSAATCSPARFTGAEVSIMVGLVATFVALAIGG